MSSPAKNYLVVVESPAKAKSIAKMLGAGYEVRASKGHVADLPEREMGVDVEQDFAPEYVVKKEKKAVVEELKKAAKGKQVLIATDPDREGEAIGWHVARLLGLDGKEPMRIEFNEITPRVVREAVQHPRPIDENLVDAQQARRILDRLVGYQLSPVLSMEFRRRALSAGRVQSVALRLLVEREAEIEAFVPQEYWTVDGFFESEASRFKAGLYSVAGKRVVNNGAFLLTNQKDASRAVEGIRQVAAWKIASVERKERKRNPSPPFITSTLQQAASSRLGWTAGRTMRVAQRLYEGIDLPEGTVGLITYMRTDSVRVSQEALSQVRRLIPEKFGSPYLPEKPNFYSTKKQANAQDAHEAIRPTESRRTPDAVRKHLEEEEFRLYQLIWQRFVASQMTPAVYDQTTVNVEGGEFVFRAVGSVIKFDGYLKVWGRDEGDEAENLLPGLREGGPAELQEVVPEQHFTEPPARYTDASLVKVLEELGIGRPSTYAPTIETLDKRQYLERMGKALKPTPLGKDVVGYLLQAFPKVLAYDFTAEMEEHLDQVEEGRAAWPGVVREFYQPFMEEYAKVPKKTCPKCGRPMELKVSRFGQFLGCTGYPECKHTERLEVRKEPEKIGEACPKCANELVRRHGRYGSFISCSTYPACDYTRDESPSIGITCPKCNTGEIVQKVSKRGKPYFRCNSQGCDFIAFDKPLPEKCPVCGWNEMQKGKKQVCSNPGCERYGGPDLKALEERRAANGNGNGGRGRAKAAARKAPAKKAKKKAASGPKAAWSDLEAHLSELAPQDAEVVRRIEGSKEAFAAVAAALGISEADVKAAHKRGLFKLRMLFGRSRSKKELIEA